MCTWYTIMNTFDCFFLWGILAGMYIDNIRSVTLVGEKERKVLKEIVKQAKTPLKNRILPPGECVVSTSTEDFREGKGKRKARGRERLIEGRLEWV